MTADAQTLREIAERVERMAERLHLAGYERIYPGGCPMAWLVLDGSTKDYWRAIAREALAASQEQRRG